MKTNYPVDMEQYEKQKENVDELLKNVAIDYSIDTLKSVSKAADILFEVYECDSRIANISANGLDAIALARSAVSFINDYIKYKELESSNASEAVLKSQKAVIFADCMGAFGTVAGRIPVIKNFAYVFTYGAEALSSGAKIIRDHISKLEEYDAILREVEGWDDIPAEANQILINTDEDLRHYDYELSQLQTARRYLSDASVDCEALDTQISVIQYAIDETRRKANDTMQKAHDETGYSPSSLSDLASHTESQKSNSSGDSWSDHTTDDTNTDSNNEYGDSGKTPPPRDPLVIDLGSKGIDLTDVNDTVFFDIDNSGFKVKTAWIGREDGFLVLDRDNSTFIENGGELFSDRVVMKDGTISSSGFEALAELDDNVNEETGEIGDGIIDKNDSEFNNLKVWIDADHDGESAKSELKTLAQLGIESIDLDYTEINESDPKTGTKITEKSYVTLTDGSKKEISEHWFQVRTYDTKERDEYGRTVVPTSIEAFGRVKNLQRAIDEDETHQLEQLVNSFADSKNYAEKRMLAREILYFITDSADIPSNARGSHIDARNLNVIEQFMGSTFSGFDGTHNPNSNAAVLLNDVFYKIENMYFNLLNRQYVIGDYLDMIFEYTDKDGNRTLDTSLFRYTVESRVSRGENVDDIMEGVSSWLYQYDKAYNTSVLQDLLSELSGTTKAYADIAEKISAANVVYENKTENTMVGSAANDIIYGHNEDSTINGGNGNDHIYSTVYDDTINGGNGNDDYYVNKDHGNVVINDTNGNNKIVFTDGLRLQDYNTYFNDALDLILYNKQTGKTVTVKNFLSSFNNFDLVFKNKTLKNTFSDHSSSESVEDGLNIISGTTGNDSINGGAFIDIIHGGDGDDTINGGSGPDVLFGGAGNDTYEIGADHGDDIIVDNEGENVILFKNGLKYSDYITEVSYKGGFSFYNKVTGDTVFVRDFMNDPLLYSFIFEDDENTLGGGAAREVFEGTAEDDVFDANDGFNIYYGREGNDTINGGANIDFMYGGDGNDTMYGMNGTNIMFGEAGNDIIYDGDNSSYLSGGDGNDELYGGGGSDVLDGGKGDDLLQGDHGNCTYVYGKGYDSDIIDASADVNDIVIKGYKAADMKLTRNVDNDLIIRFGGEGSNDKLTVHRFFDYRGNRDINFVFEAEGDKVYGQYEITENRTVKFEPAVDDNKGRWKGIYVNDDVEYYALGGNDMIGAGPGNDVLDGGSGDDTLSGSTGIDTYIFAKGYAHDTINEWSNEKSIIKLFDITSDEVEFVENGDDLDMIVKDTDDVLTINNYKNGSTYEFRFADLISGTVDMDTLEFNATAESVKLREDTVAAAREAFENGEEFALDDTDWVNTAYMHLDAGLECFGDPTKIFDRTSLFVPDTEDVFETAEKTYVGQIPVREADTLPADDISSITDKQVLILTENMSAFSNDSQISDSINIGDITADSSALDQLLVNSSMQ